MKLKYNIIKGAIATAIVIGSQTISFAEENLWVYTKGTDTRPEGSYELKLSDTIRVGKGSGSYVFHDFRPEAEYGITDRLTVGAELMLFDHNYSLNDEDNNPMYETQEANGGDYNKTRYAGYEVADAVVEGVTGKKIHQHTEDELNKTQEKDPEYFSSNIGSIMPF